MRQNRENEMDTLEKQIAFIRQAERLKSVTREAWTSDGRRESTAEHSWRLALLVGLLAPSFHVDVEKALMMCLVHDLGELYIGDISAATRPDETQKHMDEERDVRRVLSLLPDGQRDDLLALWQEYNGNATEEARLVKALDKAETILQHGFNLEYGKSYFSFHPLLKELRSILDAQTAARIREGESPEDEM